MRGKSLGREEASQGRDMNEGQGVLRVRKLKGGWWEGKSQIHRREINSRPALEVREHATRVSIASLLL